MVEWKECTIGDLCSTISETYKGINESVILVNTSDVLDGKILNHRLVKNRKLKGQFKKTFRKNDILYSEIRPKNKRFAFVDFDNTSNYIASTKLMVLRHNDAVLPEFLFLLLKSNNIIKELQHLAETRSGTFPQITFSSELAPMKVRIPNKKTQHQVISLISSIEKKIDINEKINNNLEEQIKLLCHSWLVDYAPFGYRQPSSWSTVSLSSIATFISGYSYKGMELSESDTVMATIKNFERNGGFKEIKPSSKLKPNQYADLFDTLVAHTDLTQNAEVIGNAELVLSKSGYKDIVFSMDLVKVLPKEGVSKFLLAALLRDGRFKTHALGYINGTTVLHLSKKALQEFELLLPLDLNELAPLAKAIEAMYRQIAANIDESIQLTNLRDTLLPKLMSGKLDLSHIEL